MSLKGWHRGERAMHNRLNYVSSMHTAYRWIQGGMEGEDRAFHSSLPFFPLTTLDSDGRPWGSILSGYNGRPGFLQSPSNRSLKMKAKVWEGDPLWETAITLGVVDKMLIAGLGIDFETRDRSKFAGWVSRLGNEGSAFELEVTVNQVLMNCPKYINIRELIPFPDTTPTILYKELRLSKQSRLPDDIISFVHNSDTVFLGTSYKAKKSEEKEYPSHVGMNQRGGRKGFVRVVPSDCRRVILPDYSGNRMMTSLGNIEASSLASLTFVDFESGNVLYLTGTAENLSGPDAHEIMPLQNVLTSIYVTGYIFVKDALPIRQKPGSVAQSSPYSPPIRYLAEESATKGRILFGEGKPISALLVKIDLYAPNIASFTWELSEEVKIIPGQAAVMDFTSFLGAVHYQHMAQHKPSSVNDDRIRTWTVSSAHTNGMTKRFTITMKEKSGGAVTGALFTIARKIKEQKPELLEDTRVAGMSVGLVGIVGTFTLPRRFLDPPNSGKGPLNLGLDVQTPLSSSNSSSMVEFDTSKFLWIAGGVGVTPFLSMLSALASSSSTSPGAHPDIVIVLSTREPEILLPLVADAVRPATITGVASSTSPLKLTLDVFSLKPIPDLDTPNVELRKHTGRIPRDYFSESGLGGLEKDRGVYLCGPTAFEKSVMEKLESAGVEGREVKKESFDY